MYSRMDKFKTIRTVIIINYEQSQKNEWEAEQIPSKAL